MFGADWEVSCVYHWIQATPMISLELALCWRIQVSKLKPFAKYNLPRL